MKLSQRTIAALFLAASALLCRSTTAQAGPVIEITTDAKGGIGNFSGVTFTFDGQTVAGLAGTFSTILPGGAAVDTYCVDLFHNTPIGNGGTSWAVEVLPLDGSLGAPTISNFGAIGYLYATYAAGVTTATQGAALQVAIWKAEYDPANTPLASGNFQVADLASQDAIYQQASLYLAGLGNNTSLAATELRAITHPNGLDQDLIGPAGLPASLAIAVPEPASMAMLGLGLAAAGLAAARRKRAITC